MDRAFLVLIVSLLIHVNGFSQKIHGTVMDEYGKGIQAVSIRTKTAVFQSDKNGHFELDALSGDTIVFVHDNFDDKILVIRSTNKLHIVLQRKAKEYEETKVIQKRISHFDIGYLPPIKGVQIATGTSSIINTESQSGAKSTGNPRELFAKVPGLNIWESDGAGIQMGVGGRGLSPNRAANFNMRQNGYDISADALGYPESYYTPPLEALSSIEIIRGSASLQYGTQFGGLMNFVIKDPAKDSPFEFTSRNTIGSFGYLGTFHRVGGTKKRFEYQFYHQLKKGDGYRDNSLFTQHQFFGQVGFYFTENSHVRLEFTGMQYVAQQAGGLTDALFNQNDRQSIRQRNWFKVDWNILALHYTYDFSSRSTLNIRAFGMMSSRYALGFLGKINQADPMGNRELVAGDFKNMGVEARFMSKYSIKRKASKQEQKNAVRGAVLNGLRYYQGLTQSDQGLASSGSDADFTFTNPRDLEYSSYDFPSRNLSYFVENILFLNSKWTVNAGLRLDYIESTSGGFYKKYAIHPLNNDTLGIYQLFDTTSVKRTVPLFGLGSSYKVSKTLSLYGNFCMNYRAVNFNDIRVANPNIIVDTLIKDEYGSTTEIGFRGLISKAMYIDVAAFHLFYGDKIGLAPSGTQKMRTNIGDARNMGLELFSEIDWFKAFNDSAKNSLTTFVNFSYISAHYIRSKEANYIGKEVEYVSPMMLRSGLKFKYKGFTAQVQYSFTSGQYADASNAYEPTGDAVIGYVPSYQVLDLSLRYEFKKWFQVEGGVNNLTNEKYFTRRATAYPGPGILPSDGRSFYLTLQYKFKA